MFGFPAHPKADNFRLKPNLLQTATFQIKYTAEVPVFSLLGEIIAAFLSEYPRVKQQGKDSAWEVLDDSRTPLGADKELPKSLVFSSEEQNKNFAITEDSLSMTFNGQVYTNFTEVQEEFYSAIEKISSIIKVNSFTRVAARKVNGFLAEPNLEIPRASSPWIDVLEEVFNEQLISHAIALPSSPTLVSTVVNTRFESGNDTLVLIYGLSPKEVKESSRQVILDIDIFNTEIYHSLDKVKEKLLEMNTEVFNVFMWAIKQEFISVMTNSYDSITS